MRFRRIEIQGYKSFATRTVFEIDPGVTAVVGPNGSGKSNIMDALRWVLGETATKQMRAKRLEDVIFAGSEARAPTGMAEVRLVLDNSDQWLPIEFNEVAITRRVHRTGESDFLLNDTRVRLRDIQEIFERSGLGPGSYALMGQGLVEEVLRLKPEDRRGLIEDVADVSRHRQKMGQARKKREQTHENLERARLLVEEIEPRSRTLERQAKRALQHIELSKELQLALRSYYKREIQRLHLELHSRSQTMKNATTARDMVEKNLTAAETKLKNLRAELQTAREADETAKIKQREQYDLIRDIEHQQEIEQQREAILLKRNQELEDELNHLIDQDEPKTPDGKTLEEESRVARLELEEAQEQLTRSENRRNTLRKVVQDIDTTESQKDGDGTLRNVQRDRINHDIKNIESTAELQKQAINELQLRIAETREDAKKAEEHQVEASIEAANIRTQREDLVQQFYAAGAYLRNLEASRGDRERRLSRSRDRLEMLRELQAESEGINQGFRALFGSRGAPRENEPAGIPGVVGILRHLIRAPQGLEQAIESALGKYLDSIVFETEEEACNTIQILVSEQAGRIVTLPTNRITHRNALALPNERGIIGVASELVTCNSKYRKLVDTLLGRTVIVEDIETGRNIVKRRLGSAVTRDGNLFHANGAITGGIAVEQGSFTRENELKTLPSEIETLERSLAESANLEERRIELRETEVQLKKTETESERLITIDIEARENNGKLQTILKQLEIELDFLESELKKTAEQMQGLRDIEIQLGNPIKQTSPDSETENSEQSIITALSNAEKTFDEQLKKVANATARIDVLENQHQMVEETLEANARAKTQARDQLIFRKEQKQKIVEELSTLARSIADREKHLTETRSGFELYPSATTMFDSSTPNSSLNSPEAQLVTRLETEESKKRETLQQYQREQIITERTLATQESSVREAEGAISRLMEQIKNDNLKVVTIDQTIEIEQLSESEKTNGISENEIKSIVSIENNPTANDESVEELKERIDGLRGRLRWLGNVNPEAANEYIEVKERFDFLTGQIEDLEVAESHMLNAEAELAEIIDGKFTDAFNKVDQQFRRYFQAMFQGGSARLILTDEDETELAGVDIMAQPPGKRVENLNMLSGGERALTAIALLFAMLEVNPAPFCVLDEVDAALDEANVGRFLNGLKTLGENTQFVIITHNRKSIEQADSIYGITMGEDSVSRMISVRMADIGLDEK